MKGELCLLVKNGTGDPPHGERISSAWLSIDGTLVIGPEAFSQVAGEISAPHAVEAGPHELSVRLASRPSSFITVEIRFLPEDKEPPQLSLQPAHGELIETDLPLLKVSYRDEGVGVEPATLEVFLNGREVTDRFSADTSTAAWQVGIEDYLPEGANLVQASMADRMGNTGATGAIFTVATPTEVLLRDLRTGSEAAARRAAIKLLARQDELSVNDLRMVLKRIAEFRVVEVRDAVVSIMIDRTQSPLTRAIAASALGEIAEVDEGSRTTTVVVEPLIDALGNDPSWAVKAAASRSLGLTLHPQALQALEAYLEPPYPPRPSAQDEVAFDFTKLIALQAIIRISDDYSLQHNPPTWYERQQEAIESILRYFQQFPR